MACRLFVRSVVTAVMGLLCCMVPASSVRAQDGAFARYVGRWEVRLKSLQPPKPDSTHVETYEWALGRKFLTAKSENKSEGTEDLIVVGYDPKTKGYPFWVFSSSGTYLYLPPATWDARKRVMEWKSPPQTDISYSGRCVFGDDNTRRCSVLVKDWKGRVILEQESTAVRRAN